MLKKIIAIRNVGRFKNSATQGNPQLTKHTLIVGANGYGKTTICAILRSLQTGDPAYIVGRKTLGIRETASVELLFDTGIVRFDGAAWGTTHPNFAIFDGTFITENVYSGEAVEIDQKRNLYRVIVGQEGVHLAEEDARLARESRAKTGEITAAAKVVQAHVPAGITLEQFLALPPDPDIDAKIVEQERTLEAVRQANQIQVRPALSEVTIPSLPFGFPVLLARTIDDVAQDAEQQLAEQLATHRMNADGENWISQGMAYIVDDTCPFCGRQGIHELSLISAYKAVFSAAYKALKAEIASMKDLIAQQFGEKTIGLVNTLAEKNKGNVDFWTRYCAFDALPINLPESLVDAMRLVGQAAMSLLNQKARTPLEPVHLNDVFNAALDAYSVVQQAVEATNVAIQEVNVLIAAKKAETGIHHEFVITYKNEPIVTPGGLKNSFITACGKAGIPYGQHLGNGITFHDIRRTVKTNMLSAGVDKVYRDMILGHSLTGMDVHYISPSDEDLQRAMATYTAWLDAQIQNVAQIVVQEEKKG